MIMFLKNTKIKNKFGSLYYNRNFVKYKLNITTNISCKLRELQLKGMQEYELVGDKLNL